jgi:thiosulfate/3-mercaptopyruvate sulfurtransferase
MKNMKSQEDARVKKQSNPSVIPPLISVDQLAKDINDPSVKVIDIRNNNEYKKGHIPGAVNIPFSSWTIEKNGLLLELPAINDLFRLIENAGITEGSTVVVVNKAEDVHSLTDVARVAVTLIYIGQERVTILNGGYNHWVKKRKTVSKSNVKPSPVKYKGKVNKNIFITKNYVRRNIGKSTIIDARAPEVYFGVTDRPFGMKLSFNDRMGHIPTAKSLPTPWLWNEDGTYRSTEEYTEIANGIVGKNKSREIIIYCGVGGNSAGCWYVLTRLLGYKNVKYYNGSAQEWTRDHKMPMELYKWE